MNRSAVSFIVAVALMEVFTKSGRADIAFNQIDNFQDATAMNWSGAGPTNIATGGPLGVGDRYLQVTTSGATSGPGSAMTTWNRDQWLGNYNAAGVTAIELDFKNSGPQTLLMRLAFRVSPPGDSSTPGYVSSTPFNLSADGLWHHATISLDSSAMSVVGSPGVTFSQLLTSGLGELRIIHSASVDLLGNNTAPTPMQLGIDNIHAAPEPGSLSLLAAGTLVSVARRRRRAN